MYAGHLSLPCQITSYVTGPSPRRVYEVSIRYHTSPFFPFLRILRSHEGTSKFCFGAISLTTISRKHYRYHDPPLPCPHDACDEKHAQKKGLDRHIRSNHKSWAIKHPELANLSPLNERRCENCGYTADRPDNVKRHVDRGVCLKKAK